MKDKKEVRCYELLFGEGSLGADYGETLTNAAIKILIKVKEVLPKINVGVEFRLSELIYALGERQSYDEFPRNEKVAMGCWFADFMQANYKDAFTLVRKTRKIYYKREK